MVYEHNKIWRNKYPEKWLAEKKKYYDKTSGPEKNRNYRLWWSRKDDKALFHTKLTDTELHRILGRSVMAIQVRRCKILQGYV